jgi:hypothetical protein
MGGKNEFTLAVILECLAPGGVGVHVVEDHDVTVAEAGEKGKTAHLFHVQCVLLIDDQDEDVVHDNVCRWGGGGSDPHRCVGENHFVRGNRGINGTSGLDALVLSLYVTHLSILQFRKILGDIFYVDDRPKAVVALSNGFEPCYFGEKAGGSM